MKRLICILLLLALLACVPTPDHEIIENKGDKKDWQVDAQPVSDTVLLPVDPETAAVEDYERQDGPLYERLNAPKLWNTENNEFGFPIVAKDCPVFLPDASAVPAVEAETRALTQADVDAVISVVFPVDGVKWYPEVGITKEDCTEVIRGAQEALEKAEPGSEMYDILKKKLEEKNELYSKIYAVAPFAADIQPIEPVLGTYPRGYNTDSTVWYINGLDVHASVAGEEWTLGAYTGDEIYGNSVYASRNGDLWSESEQPLDAPYGVKMTRAEALAKASEIAQKLTGSELAPCYCAPIYFHTNEGPDLSRRFSQWRVVLMRTVNGVGTAYAKEDVGSDMNSTVTKPIGYERLTIDMDDHGVSALKWINPMRITGVVQSDAKLISFDEAAGKAMQHIAARWTSYIKSKQDDGKSASIYLRRVTMGLWRIAKQNGGWYYVPVYHFFTEASDGDWSTTAGLWSEDMTSPRERFLAAMERYAQSVSAGEAVDFENDPAYRYLDGSCLTFGTEYWGGITVNALDGTIIDKDKGY